MSKMLMVTMIFTILVIIMSIQFSYERINNIYSICYKGIKSKNLDLFVEGLITLLISLCFGTFIFLC